LYVEGLAAAPAAPGKTAIGAESARPQDPRIPDHFHHLAMQHPFAELLDMQVQQQRDGHSRMSVPGRSQALIPQHAVRRVVQ